MRSNGQACLNRFTAVTRHFSIINPVRPLLARKRHAAAVALWPLLREDRKSDFGVARTFVDPRETSAGIWRDYFNLYRMVV